MGAEEIRVALNAAFPGANIEIEYDPANERYSGYMLWGEFQNRSFVERQSSVFQTLRHVFGPEAQNISFIFTYTPAEYEQLQAA